MSSFVFADWTRFRGPNGTGVASDSKTVPTRWSDSENVKWKLPMPGPGSSCPIVTGDKVFITYWSGYATDPENLGNMEDLRIHLMCVDRNTGKTVWDRAVNAKLPEQEYGGMFSQHGYASHTPVTDGERVYAYFGKSGVHAFDLEGNPLWSAHVGDDLDQRGWGSASSPVLTRDALIVTGTIENHAMVAYDKKTGKELWNKEAEGFGSTWGTPVVIKSGEVEEVVLGVPQEIWALDAATGKLRWYSDGIKGDAVTGSVITKNEVIYAAGSRGAGSIAVRAGGSGDVNDSHIVWTGRDGSNITSPILYKNRLYWITGSIVHCRDAKTGGEIYAQRLPGAEAEPERQPRSGNRENYRPGRSGGEGARGGGGGRFGSLDYASPVIADDHLFQQKRKGETIVLKLAETFELVARNNFASDQSDFSATPAISDGQIFLRSYKNLYCISE